LSIFPDARTRGVSCYGHADQDRDLSQLAWMKQHVEYECLGRPRPGVTFNNCGTLHGDGTFEPLKNLVAVKLRSECMSVLVGVAVRPISELR
jgi:hypothetical protein